MDSIDYRRRPVDSTPFGYIVITARSANEGFPIEGARVTISEAGEDEAASVVAVTKTDSSGKTERIRVQTPPKYLSENPGATEPPFASYNVVTEKDGYYTVTNVGMPVYPGVVSVQPVAMVPLEFAESEELYPTDTDRFTETTPPNL